MRVIFLGPPGAGKGTQAQLIHKKTNTPILVMGDMLRESVRKGDEVGKEAESYMKKGELVPDEVVIKVILSRLKAEDCQNKGFILDGFPRTVEQAQALERDLREQQILLDTVVYFSVPDEIVVERISGRLVCKECKAVFGSLDTSSCPKENCQGELEKRADDKPEIVAKRLEEYQKTSPLVDYYRNKNLLKEVPATRTVDEVFTETMSHLQEFCND